MIMVNNRALCRWPLNLTAPYTQIFEKLYHVLNEEMSVIPNLLACNDPVQIYYFEKY